LLEPDARQRACPVLRGVGRSNAPDLPGELIGHFTAAGREWEPQGEPTKTLVHDFVDKQLGKVAPYGVYDIAANTGWVNVGTDADTGQFAVESIRRWWLTMGASTYPDANRLLITADSGGSNGSRLRLWKPSLPPWPPRPAFASPSATCRPARPSGTGSSTCVLKGEWWRCRRSPA